MWKATVMILTLLGVIYGGVSFPNPDGPDFQMTGDHIEANSFGFLNKLSQKNYRAITSLIISNASLNKVDPKLKYLKNLHYLDLSYNNIQISSIPSLVNLKTLKLNGNSLKYINLTALPQNIENLDISYNLLTSIPKDWRSLKSLKTLHLHKNPIDCNCYTVLNYERLIKSNIEVPRSILCHSPRQFLGKDIASVNCSLDDIMLYDEPVEGSGSEDIFENNLNDERINVPFVHERESDDFDQENNTIIDDKLPEENLMKANLVTSQLGLEQEGSGDEGSGFGIYLPESGILGCIENCSTPGPIGSLDDDLDSAPPNAIDQMGIFFDDINLFKEVETSTTTTISTTSTTSKTTTTLTTTQAPFISEKEVVEEPQILKINKSIQHADKPEDVEVFPNSTDTKELERASVAPQNSNAVYAVVGVGIFLAIVFLICFIKKRKIKRHHKNRREIPPLGEEMKSLNKPLIQAINEKPVKQSSNIPENTPLINGQNGKYRSESPAPKSYTPMAHPETGKEDETPLPTNAQSDLIDEIEIRPKPQPELLTVQRERVTIRESEIPEAIPKTPLLVHRQKNSEGEIVTTLVP